MVGSGRTGSGESGIGQLTADLSQPVGARVWLLTQGWSGRVVARAHGGLLYRVRREADGTTPTVICTGSELLRLHDEPPLD